MEEEHLTTGEKAEDYVIELLKQNEWIVVHNNGSLRKLLKEPFKIPEKDEEGNEVKKGMNVIAQKYFNQFFIRLKTTFKNMNSDKFDFIAKRDNTIIMADVKGKTEKELEVDEYHYKKYREFNKVIPFLIFFCRGELPNLEIRVGMTRDPTIEPRFKPHGAHDRYENLYTIHENETMPITEWFSKDCSLEALRTILPKEQGS